MEISTYVALLNAQNAEIIWYVDGRIIKRKSPKNGQSSVITFVPYSIVQGVLHVTVIPSMLKSSSVINVHLNRILSQPDIIKQIASNVIEELKQKHSNQTEIKYDIDSLENKKLSLKHNKNDC